MRVREREAALIGSSPIRMPDRPPSRTDRTVKIWTVFVVAALLLMDVLDLTVYGIVIPVAACAVGLVASRVRRSDRSLAWVRNRVDRRDLLLIAALYLVVVGLFRLAFEVFTTDRVAGLFLSFAAALLIGVAGPVVYTKWVRGRPLASLGMGRQNLGRTVRLGLLFAGVQFAITLWGYDLPEPVDWVPLLVMALTVGLFEAIFFRGFIQGRLEDSLGLGPAVYLAAGLYALYHVGYGMGADEMVFLFGLGVVYAIAYRLAGNVLVLWPLLIPLGSFYAQLDSGDLVGDLPWGSVAGFADVLVAMGVVVWLAHRSERRRGVARRSSALAEAGAG